MGRKIKCETKTCPGIIEVPENMGCVVCGWLVPKGLVDDLRPEGPGSPLIWKLACRCPSNSLIEVYEFVQPDGTSLYSIERNEESGLLGPGHTMKCKCRYSYTEPTDERGPGRNVVGPDGVWVHQQGEELVRVITAFGTHRVGELIGRTVQRVACDPAGLTI
jgi:hypothetical protein